MERSLSVSLKAGALIGFLAGVAFALAHLLLIKPVAVVFLVAPSGAAVQGAAVGWAWHRLRRARPRLRGVAVGALFAASLAPVGALAAVATCETEAGARPACFAVLLAPPLVMLLAGAILTRNLSSALVAALAGAALVLPLGRQTLTAGEPSHIKDTVFFDVVLLLLVGAGAMLERVEARVARRGPSATA